MQMSLIVNWKKVLFCLSLSLLISVPALALDPYAVSEVDPKLPTLPAFRDIPLNQPEYTDNWSSHLEDVMVFSPDARSLFVQSARFIQGGGTAEHIFQFDVATGKVIRDIPISHRFAGNPLNTLFAPHKTPPLHAEKLAVQGPYLAALVLVGYQPKRWIPVLFDTRSGKVTKVFNKITEGINSTANDIQITPDGRYLIVDCEKVYAFDIASGKPLPDLQFYPTLQEADANRQGHLFGLNDGQVAFFGSQGEDEENNRRIFIFDLNQRSVSESLGEGLTMGGNLNINAMLNPERTMAIMPARAEDDDSNDSRCAGGDPCLRLYKFPEMEDMMSFRVKNNKGQILTEWVPSHHNESINRYAFNPADPRVLMLGRNDYAGRKNYALMFDTLESGDIAGWYILPFRQGNGDSPLEVGLPEEGGYIIAGIAAGKTGTLRLVKIPPAP